MRFTTRASTMNAPFVVDLRLPNAHALGACPTGSCVRRPSAAILRASAVIVCPMVAPTGGVLAATQVPLVGACRCHISAGMDTGLVAPRPRSAVRGVSGDDASLRLALMGGGLTLECGLALSLVLTSASLTARYVAPALPRCSAVVIVGVTTSSRIRCTSVGNPPTRAPVACRSRELHDFAEHSCVARVVWHHVTVARVSIFGIFLGAEAP